MKQSLLQRLIERRDRLDAAIEVLRDELGDQPVKRIYRHAAKALEATGNGSAPSRGLRQYERLTPEQKAARVKNERLRRRNLKAPKRYPSGQRKYTALDSKSVYRGTNREIKKLEVPSGVSFEGIDVEKGIVLAIKAIGEPIPTPELRLLLETAGVKFPKTKMPRNRYVGVIAARLEASGELRRTAEGWTAAAKNARR